MIDQLRQEISDRIAELETELARLRAVDDALGKPEAPFGYLPDGVTPRKRRPNRAKRKPLAEPPKAG